MKVYSRYDRTGQVWEDKSFDDAVFLVVGPPEIDKDGDAMHPVALLVTGYGTPGYVTFWYEFAYMLDWETDTDMTRLA